MALGDSVINTSRGRFYGSQRDPGKSLRCNEQIRISPVRLIDENDQQVGVIDLIAAKIKAKEAGLDLVEVSPQSSPPVCRIMDYGKWKYQQKKKEQKARSHSKQSELKEVRLRPKIDDHDLDIKVQHARAFLEDGDKVQFTLMFRGREMAHREIGLAVMHGVRDRLAEVSKVETEPRMMGKRMTMVLVPERRSSAKPAPGSAPAPGAAPAPGSATAPASAAGSQAKGSTLAKPPGLASAASGAKPAASATVRPASSQPVTASTGA